MIYPPKRLLFPKYIGGNHENRGLSDPQKRGKIRIREQWRFRMIFSSLDKGFYTPCSSTQMNTAEDKGCKTPCLAFGDENRDWLEFLL